MQVKQANSLVVLVEKAVEVISPSLCGEQMVPSSLPDVMTNADERCALDRKLKRMNKCLSEVFTTIKHLAHNCLNF